MRIEHLPEEKMVYSQAFESVSDFFSSETGESFQFGFIVCFCICLLFFLTFASDGM